MEYLQTILNFISGGYSANGIATICITLFVGIFASLLLSALTRNQSNENHPKQFSWLYLIFDNWFRILVSSIISYCIIRFGFYLINLNLTEQTTLFPSLGTGFIVDNIIGLVKKKTNLLNLGSSTTTSFTKPNVNLGGAMPIDEIVDSGSEDSNPPMSMMRTFNPTVTANTNMWGKYIAGIADRSKFLRAKPSDLGVEFVENAVDDFKVKASASDTTAGFLDAKVDNVTISVVANKLTVTTHSDFTWTGALTTNSFPYSSGRVCFNNVVTDVSSGSLDLSAYVAATVYVQVNTSGVVIENNTGFVSGNIPLYQVTMVASVITVVTDKRSWLSATGLLNITALSSFVTERSAKEPLIVGDNVISLKTNGSIIPFASVNWWWGGYMQWDSVGNPVSAEIKDITAGTFTVVSMDTGFFSYTAKHLN